MSTCVTTSFFNSLAALQSYFLNMFNLIIIFKLNKLIFSFNMQY